VADRTQALPLSFAQQRLWFLEQLGGLGSTYHIPAGPAAARALDREALRGALDRIVERHEALRTTFFLVMASRSSGSRRRRRAASTCWSTTSPRRPIRTRS
jgi:hypothetical protein